ncbi:hypothetical protein ACRJ4W_41930 [Streptomyces sp. GLT-R25]
MAIWQACLWSLLGVCLIEGWDLYEAIHDSKGFPWRKRGRLKLAPYLVSALIRLGIGAGLGAVFAQSGQVSGAVGFAAVGIAAPKILEQLARRGLTGVPGEVTSSQPQSTITPSSSATSAGTAMSAAEPSNSASEGGAIDAN